ncbi:MAG: hypothetical protein JJT81_09330 [Rubellimicrobium sp.]|nr:hypothetical protein [Rubellimicrobium sp.]
MNTLRMIAGGLIGLFFGTGAALAISPGLVGFWVRNDEIGGLILLIVIACGGVLGFFAPTIRRAFGRGIMFLGVCVVLLPVMSMLFSGWFPTEGADAAAMSSAYMVVGAGLAAVAVNGVATVIGLIFGTILMAAGVILCMGGRRDVGIAPATAAE